MQTVRRTIAALETARERGCEWICSRMGAGGEAAGAASFNTYYRLPWALAVAGRRGHAAAALAWIERHALDERRDLRAGSPRQPFVTCNASYPLAQIAIGAWLLEHYGLARRVMRRLAAAYVDPVSGGAYTERPEARATGRCDLLGTAQLGLAALATGDHALAAGCHRWLAALYAAQPELPRRLYTAMTAGTLLLAPSEHVTPWNLVTDFHQPFQQFYNPGAAAAFLGRHHAATGDEGALALAADFLRLTALGDELQFDHTVNSQACKFSWGASVLLEVAPREEYLAYALKMAEWYLASQQADGRWHPSGFLCPQPTDADDMPKVAEHVLHVANLVAALSRHLAAREDGPDTGRP